MKILIVEDDPKHQDAARRLLGEDYELEIISNPDTAKERLEPQFDAAKEAQLLEAAGFPKGFSAWDKSVSDETRKKYWDEQRKAHKESRLPFAYDAVLLDLMLPATRAAMGDAGMKFVGQLMPYGYSLAIHAIQNGAKKVGILTETNHHMHPMSAALDSLRLGKVMQIDDSKFVLARELSASFMNPEKTCTNCDGSEKNQRGENCYYCKGTGKEHFYAKDWKKLLDILNGVKTEEHED